MAPEVQAQTAALGQGRGQDRDGLGWGWRQGCPKLGSLSRLGTSAQPLHVHKHKFPWGNASSCPVWVGAISSSHGGVGSEAATVAEVRAGSVAAS